MTTALVIGGAACVWADVEAALSLAEFDGVVACNDVGSAWPGELDAWVSLHGDKFALWAERRHRAGHAPAHRLYAHAEFNSNARPRAATHSTDYRFPRQRTTGSSGLFALKVALVDLGFDRAVLCGVPMDAGQGHYFREAAWRAARSHQRGWQEAIDDFRHRARSMSGWTRDLLGAPDEGWLSA